MRIWIGSFTCSVPIGLLETVGFFRMNCIIPGFHLFFSGPWSRHRVSLCVQRGRDWTLNGYLSKTSCGLCTY